MDKLIRFLESLPVSQGPLAGQRFRVLPWERRFIKGAFAPNVRTAALSVARGNGKTTLTGGIGLAAVIGPLAQLRAEAVAVASSFSQARILLESAEAFARPWRDKIRVVNNSNTALLEYKPTGSRLRCIAADPRRAHGLQPSLLLLDEPAQWAPAQADRLLAALMTSIGKIQGARVLAFGTTSDDPEHWFSKALEHWDYTQLHAADVDDPPFQRRTWKKANPSLDAMPGLEATLRSESRLAKQDETLRQSFDSLRLNLPVPDADRHLLVSSAQWLGLVETAALPEREGQPVYGIDLGSGRAMSVVSAYWTATGRLETIAALPAEPSLLERGKRAGVGDELSRMNRRGELVVLGKHVVDVEGLLREALARFGRPSAVACDRWREAELRQELEKAGIPLCDLEVRGQGWKDGGEDVRDFLKGLVDGRIQASESLLMRAAWREAVGVSDAAGNVKLAKGSEGGRRGRALDDAAASMLLSVAVGSRRPQSVPAKRRWSIG